jgi:hypothetical protein
MPSNSRQHQDVQPDTYTQVLAVYDIPGRAPGRNQERPNDTVEATSHHSAGPIRSKIHTCRTTARLYHLMCSPHTVMRLLRSVVAETASMGSAPPAAAYTTPTSSSCRPDPRHCARPDGRARSRPGRTPKPVWVYGRGHRDHEHLRGSGLRIGEASCRPEQWNYPATEAPTRPLHRIHLNNRAPPEPGTRFGDQVREQVW